MHAALTFPARASLDEDDWRLLQLHRAVTHALQLAHVSVGDAVAAAHRLGAAAHAHARLTPPPNGGGYLHAVGHHALHALRALLLRAAAAPLALAGRAHRAAVAAVQHVSGQAVCGDRGALGLVAGLRTADGEALGDPRRGRLWTGAEEQRRDAREEPETHDGTDREEPGRQKEGAGLSAAQVPARPPTDRERKSSVRSGSAADKHRSHVTSAGGGRGLEGSNCTQLL